MQRWFLLIWSSALFIGAIIPSPSIAQPATTITVVNLDGAGEGFNDLTAVAPVGGNSGTTLGAQRLNAFQFAANIWAGLLSSAVVIRVGAKFDPQFCDANSAVLGSARPESVHANFAGAPVTNTWYPQALANSLRGIDLNPGVDDISTTFNSSIGTTCPFPQVWYYGLDRNAPANTNDFVTVVLHELGHGLGFTSGVTLGTGAKLAGLDDAYMRLLEDHSTGILYPQMTDAQRVSASTNTGNLHWTGANVVGASGVLTAGRHPSGHVQMFAPNPQQGGSSVSHFDTALEPNQLMEPSYTGPNHNVGLALNLMQDLGWVLSGTPIPPTVTIAATDSTAAESPLNTGTFTVTRTGSTALALTVFYSVSGTATPGSDYQALSGNVAIPAGQSSATITVTPINDVVVGEGNETVIVTLTANAAYIVGGSNSATVTITDNSVADPALPIVSVVATDPTATEAGQTTGTFTFTRTGPTNASLLVTYMVSGTANPGADYTAITANVTIPAGSSSATRTVTPVDDAAIEGDETVIVRLNANANYNVGAPDAATITIVDKPNASVNNVAVTEGNSGTANAVFTVTLSAASAQTVTVNFSTANGTAAAGADYVAQSGVVTFTPGQTSKTITVVVNGDSLVEPNETFFVNLSSPTNATIAAGQGIGTILNDDVAERLSNISTRGSVLTGANVMIGGFIIEGSAPKRVLVRSRGPSMGAAPFFVPGALSDPVIQIFSGQTVIALNDDWQDAPSCSPQFVCEGAAAIIAIGLDPCRPNPGQAGAPLNCFLESAILITLPPGAYTAIVTGFAGATGVGLVEVFEAEASLLSELSNISTRGFVQSGANVMIGGVIIEGDTLATVLIRARGPSMSGAPFFVPGTLANPFMQIFSGQNVIAQNDNWQDAPNCPDLSCGGAAQITATGLDPCTPNPGQAASPPGCALESAMLITLPPGAYTAIVSGVGGGTGVGIVEVFEID